MSGYQEYCNTPSGERDEDAGTCMAHQMIGPNFTRYERAFPATAQGPAAGKAESISSVSARIHNFLLLETWVQGRDLNPDFLRALRTKGLPACIFLGLSPGKLKPRMIVQKKKPAKPKESSHHMEE
ncbi:hypothetical protein DSO57_1015895 [Entomophthora muscae]|uniref:Uncharacterized protein n=1 Tax=Entomophthora muscae TaxID=34485 RepID=A0ACC2S6Y6_9FUNG|nr:hypothetical protein DSO57_1015895 [Entomophthora muscae]